jgi:tetratricopeptide (TPR) repeat protein
MKKTVHKQKLLVNAEIRQLAFDIKSSMKPLTEEGASVRLALFLGAGASMQSDVPATRGMIRHFKNEIFKRHGKEFLTDAAGSKWLETQTWFKDDENEYCCLFEQCYPTEAKRRSYIESIIERKQPSVGYIILANLIKLGFIKTIITTNFDSLISLACSNYTDIFPVVYSLGNFASEMAVSSERPRILKIHGDFLYSRLKNTTAELEEQDQNMKKQVQKILEEYDGLIIAGYSGNDHSVMKLIEQIPDGKTFYWCGLSENELSNRAIDLLNSKKGIFVKIEGFDELMHIVRVLIGITNSDITKTFQNRQIAIDKKLGEFDDIIISDEAIADLAYTSDFTDFDGALEKTRNIVGLFSVANKAKILGDFAKAENIYQEILRIDPNNANAHYWLGNMLYTIVPRNDDSEKSLRKAIALNPKDASAYNLLGLIFFRTNRLEEALFSFKKAYDLEPQKPTTLLSLASFHKGIGDLEKSKDFITLATTSIPYYDNYLLACLNAVRNDNKEALRYLEIAVDKEPYCKYLAKVDPEFIALRKNAKFKTIIK